MDGSEVSLRDCDCGHWTGCNAKVTDEALIGELVKRGVLTAIEGEFGSRQYVSGWKPVAGRGKDD